MGFLSDDPTCLAAALGLAALVCLVLLKVTQQGKYLIWAGVAALALLVLLSVERAWVTDAERIEATVYGLAAAVERSDADAAAEFLAPECTLAPSSNGDNLYVRYVSSHFAGPVDRDRLAAQLPRFTFDYVRVSRLSARAGEMSRTGTAEFVVHAWGMQTSPSPAALATPPAGMGWSLGFREMSPGVWKVTRITPGQMGGG